LSQQLIGGVAASSRIAVAGINMGADHFEPAQGILKEPEIRFSLDYTPRTIRRNVGRSTNAEALGGAADLEPAAPPQATVKGRVGPWSATAVTAVMECEAAQKPWVLGRGMDLRCGAHRGVAGRLAHGGVRTRADTSRGCSMRDGRHSDDRRSGYRRNGGGKVTSLELHLFPP
jgi:hypothetical protein